MKNKKIFGLLLAFVMLFNLFAVVACNDNADAGSVIQGLDTSLTLEVGGRKVLSPSVKDVDDATFLYSSADKTVVTVDENGIVLAKAVGTTSVTVIAMKGGDTLGSFKISVEVKEKGSTPSNRPVVSVSADKTTLKKGETAQITVSVTNADDTGYTLKSSDETLLTVTNAGVATAVGDARMDTNVIVTATSAADANATGSVVILIKAPVVAGEYQGLTSAAIEKISGNNITVTGTVQDVVQNLVSDTQTSGNLYDYTVKMNEGAWYGYFEQHNKPATGVSNNYRKADYTVNTTESYGTGYRKATGNPMLELYVDKDNRVASKEIKDYLSQITLWNNQHLWNHLAQLISAEDWYDAERGKFTYDADNKVYKYKYDETDENDLYLMAYLAWSLTPMLDGDDQIVDLWIRLDENFEVAEIIAQTVPLYDAEEIEDATKMSYTEVHMAFSDVGETEMPQPKVYTIPEANQQYYDKLQAALGKMQAATNYTFAAVETSTYAPSYDPDDYTVESTSSAKITTQSTTQNKSSLYDTLSATGTVGIVGYVTEKAILLANTSQYLDGDSTGWSGYYQVDSSASNPSFDYFEWGRVDSGEKDSAGDTLYYGKMIGKKKYFGNLNSMLPTFDFSPALFSFDFAKSNGEKMVYQFTLKETAVTRDVALQVSMHNYAKDADGTETVNKLTIVVDDDGNLVSVTYPYNLTYGTYLGYITTTFSNIGSTTVDEEAVFNEYQPRVIGKSWSDYEMKSYYITVGDNKYATTNAAICIEAIQSSAEAADFNVDYKGTLPDPAFFFDIFGDNFYGPFYDNTGIIIGRNSDGTAQYRTDENGKEIEVGSFCVTAESTEFDENVKITNYEKIMDDIDSYLTNLGYTYLANRSDTTGGESGRANRVVYYTNGDVLIRIENNFTKYFWLYFYVAGTV